MQSEPKRGQLENTQNQMGQRLTNEAADSGSGDMSSHVAVGVVVLG
jgi:hypothetical protein